MISNECFVKNINTIIAGGPLQRLRSWLLLQRRSHSAATLHKPSAERLRVQPSLLPSHLPPCPFAKDGCDTRESHSSEFLVARRAAWTIVEWLCVVSSYYETGCPKAPHQFEKRFGPYQVSEQQQQAAS